MDLYSAVDATEEGLIINCSAIAKPGALVAESAMAEQPSPIGLISMKPSNIMKVGRVRRFRGFV